MRQQGNLIQMDSGSCFSYVWRLLIFVPVFISLFILGILKALAIAPVVFMIIVVGSMGIIFGMYPCHSMWTCYCILRTEKFGSVLKSIILLLVPLPIILWPILATVTIIFAGIGFGVGMPLIATFESIQGVPGNKLSRCFKDGTWSSIRRACTMVCDFKDVCFYSYFSVMDGLLEARGDTIFDLKISQIPGCLLALTVGVLIDVPIISVIVVYKIPVMLYKGWRQLLVDLVGRSGPFSESVCVPFAGLLILLWPIAVSLAAVAGILSSLSLGLFAATVVYQENSVKSGLLYAVAIISQFDEFTNDFLYMREGSCFPRPQYWKPDLSRAPSLPVKHAADQSDFPPLKNTFIKAPSVKIQELTSVMIWENFLKACEYTAKELIDCGAIWASDLEEWQNSKNKIINVGLPSYVFLQCFIRSINLGSAGFLMRDNVELNSVNRPEGRVFEWLFEPMLLIKEQIKAANLQPAEESYLYKLTLFCGNAQRVDAWENGGVPPAEEIKRAQLEGLSRRLQGFCLTLSRMPTFRRRFSEVVNASLQEARERSDQF